MKPISRRTVLRGLGGVAIPLPFLDIMARPRAAQAQSAITKTGLGGAPKRFVTIYTPCGQGPDWLKTSNGADGKLVFTPSLKNLDRHKNDILMIQGLDNKSAIYGDTSGIDPGHQKPFVNLMTCVASNKVGIGGGISIDQAIAKEIAGGTKFPSLQLGVNVQGSQANMYMSYSAAGVGLPAQNDPKKAWDKLFTDLMTDPNALLKIQADRKSVLDGIKQDYTSFALRMSSDDRTKVNNHLDGIRTLEANLMKTGGGGAQTCKKPTKYAGATDSSAYIDIGNAQMDILSIALACDLTRVVTLQFEGSGGNHRLPGFNRGIHDASHDFGPSGATERNKYTAWYTDYFAKFFDKMKATSDGGGSVFDNTVFYWTSEHGAGNHNYDMMTVMVAGGGGGYFKMGRHVPFPNGSTGKGLGFCNQGNCPGANGPGVGELYVSFMNAMGIDTKTFGNPSYCRGPLPNLTA